MMVPVGLGQPVKLGNGEWEPVKLGMPVKLGSGGREPVKLGSPVGARLAAEECGGGAG